MGLFHSFSYDILQNKPEKPQLSPPGNRRAASAMRCCLWSGSAGDLSAGLAEGRNLPQFADSRSSLGWALRQMVRTRMDSL